MEFRVLRYFLTVAREESITGATLNQRICGIYPCFAPDRLLPEMKYRDGLVVILKN